MKKHCVNLDKKTIIRLIKISKLMLERENISEAIRIAAKAFFDKDKKK